MVITAIIISVLYLLLVGAFIIGFDSLQIFKKTTENPKIKFSVVIPFRNESENLPLLLDSIKKLTYPKDFYELLFVDDSSTDNSVKTIETYLENNLYDWKILENISNTNSPKKEAIKTAIIQSKYDWIITTDADCELPEKWLNTYDAYIQQQDNVLIAGPVKYQNPKTFLDHFQNLDFMSLIGSTIGSFGTEKPFMANGANLAYKKAFFYQLNGFEDDANIASGDDVFLLQKAAKYNPKKVGYLKSKEAIVSTIPQPTWHKLISQRVRWASKSTHYKNSFSIFTGFTVFAMNAVLMVCLLTSLLALTDFFILLCLFCIKLILDFILIYKTSCFLNQKFSFVIFIFSSFLYPFFTTYIVILSTFRNYDWKGRTFNK